METPEPDTHIIRPTLSAEMRGHETRRAYSAVWEKSSLPCMLAGLVVAAVVHWAEKQPTVLAGALILFVAFEVGFYAMSSAFGSIPVLGVLAWYNVALGNLIASVVMGAYMWRTHPALKAELLYALEGKE